MKRNNPLVCQECFVENPPHKRDCSFYEETVKLSPQEEKIGEEFEDAFGSFALVETITKIDHDRLKKFFLTKLREERERAYAKGHEACRKFYEMEKSIIMADYLKKQNEKKK